MDKFILHSEYKPTGDQPQAIEKLSDGVKRAIKNRPYLVLRVVVRPLLWRIL